jgi:putative MATE family efflux protein
MNIVHTENLRRTVLQIAWPIVLRTFLNTVVQMVDMIMVGKLGATALAAAGLGNQAFFFTISVVQAFSIGTTTLVAQAVGKNDMETAKKIAGQSLAAVLITTFLLSAIIVTFSRQIINGIVYFMPEKDLELINLASQYLAIVGISISLRFTLLIVNAIFQGAGNTRTPLYLMILCNLVNVTGNYFLIFGVGPFPALGVQGAAIATCGAGLLAGGLGIGLLFSRFSPVRLQFKILEFFSLQKQVISGVLSVGIPSAIEQAGIHVAQIAFSMIVASLGTMAIAAQQITHTAFTMTNLPGLGFSMAATTLVGQFIGAGKREQALKSGMETARLALICMLACGLLFIISPQSIINLFTKEAAVLELAHTPLILIGLAQPAMAYAASLTGGLRGAGDTLWAMYLTLLNTLGVRLLLTLSLVYTGWGLTGVWAAMIVEIYLRGTFIFLRFKHKIPQISSLLHSVEGIEEKG